VPWRPCSVASASRLPLTGVPARLQDGNCFALGARGDAADALTAFFAVVGGGEPARRAFGVDVADYVECPHCGRFRSFPAARGEVHSAPMAALLSHARELASSSGPPLGDGDLFTQSWRDAARPEQRTACYQPGCEGVYLRARVLRSAAPTDGRALPVQEADALPDAAVLPRTFIMRPGWEVGDANWSPTACARDVAELMSLLPVVHGGNFRQLYDDSLAPGDDRRGGARTHRLGGFIAYYGKHYVAFWRREGREHEGEWEFLDDATVLGPLSWEAVAEKVKTGKWLPVVLFFCPMPEA
jgi:hypothetical protein